MTTLMTISKTQYPSLEDSRLAQQACTEPQAFAALYRRHVRSIYRYHLAHTGTVRDAWSKTFARLIFKKAFFVLLFCSRFQQYGQRRYVGRRDKHLSTKLLRFPDGFVNIVRGKRTYPVWGWNPKANFLPHPVVE